MIAVIERLAFWSDRIREERERNRPRRWELKNLIDGFEWVWSGPNQNAIERFLDRCESDYEIDIEPKTGTGRVSYRSKAGIPF